MGFQLDDYVSINRGGTPGNGGSGTYYVGTLRDLMNDVWPHVFHFSGSFDLTKGQVTGWGVYGHNDQLMQFGIETAADWLADNLNMNSAGGIQFPYDVKLKRLRGFLDLNNTKAVRFGFASAFFTPQDGNEIETWTKVLDEMATDPTGTRQYGDLVRHIFDITRTSNDSGTDYIADVVIPAGSILTFGMFVADGGDDGVECRIPSAFMEFERV